MDDAFLSGELSLRDLLGVTIASLVALPTLRDFEKLSCGLHRQAVVKWEISVYMGPEGRLA